MESHHGLHCLIVKCYGVPIFNVNMVDVIEISMLGKNSADNILKCFFVVFFSRKQDLTFQELTFHANCFPRRKLVLTFQDLTFYVDCLLRGTICMKCQLLLSGKMSVSFLEKNKSIISLSSAEFAKCVVLVIMSNSSMKEEMPFNQFFLFLHENIFYGYLESFV